jgi:hypothetical protein
MKKFGKICMVLCDTVWISGCGRLAGSLPIIVMLRTKSLHSMIMKCLKGKSLVSSLTAVLL